MGRRTEATSGIEDRSRPGWREPRPTHPPARSGHPAGGRRGKVSGLTFVEILLAVAILGGLLVSIMQMFAVTRRRSLSTEAMLSSSLLAQMVVERLKSHLTMNPRFLRDLAPAGGGWSFRGTVVAPPSAVNTGLKLSPFFEYLFVRGSGSLYQDSNRVSIAPASGGSPQDLPADDLQAMLLAYRDHEVAITIDDDRDLENPASPTPYQEIVKRVAVTVSRSSVVARDGEDPLRFSLTARVMTPGDSLSVGALQDLVKRFEGPTLEQLWKEFFLMAGTNPYFQGPTFTEASRNILADAFLILAGANVESQRVTGEPIPESLLIDGDPAAEYLEAWVDKLAVDPAVRALSSSKTSLARLYGLEAVVIFDAFKKIRLPMEHFVTEVMGPVPGGLSPGGPTLLQKLRDLALLLDQLQAGITAIEGQADQLAGEFATVQDQIGDLKAQQADSGSTTPDPALGGVLAAGAGIESRAVALKSQLNGLVAGARTQIQGMFEEITLASFLQQLFTDPKYSRVAFRPGDYHNTFRGALDDLSGILVEHLDQPQDVTPLERMNAAKLYCEVSMVRQLDRDAPDPGALDRLKKEAEGYKGGMLQLAQYLGQGEVHDLATLEQRNAEFSMRAADLHRLGPAYRDTARLFEPPNGEIASILARYAGFGEDMDLDVGGILDGLDGILDGLGGILGGDEDKGPPKN